MKKGEEIKNVAELVMRLHKTTTPGSWWANPEKRYVGSDDGPVCNIDPETTPLPNTNEDFIAVSRVVMVNLAKFALATFEAVEEGYKYPGHVAGFSEAFLHRIWDKYTKKINEDQG